MTEAEARLTWRQEDGEPEPFAIVSVEEMRALEAAAMEAGTPERVLQERAGLAVADVVEEELAALGFEHQVAGFLGARRRPRILVLAGTGNNGRDGVVAGRRLAARGCHVQFWHGPRSPLSRHETLDIVAEGIQVRQFDAQTGTAALSAALEGVDIAIDALLGVGSRGALRPDLAAVASAVHKVRSASPAPRVVAVDVPSGIDSDTGAVPGGVVPADVTVTFGAVKAGLLRFPAAYHVGKLVTARIGLPTGAADSLPLQVLDEGVARSLLPVRPLDAHKYKFGRVLVVAGSDQFVGAACMSSEAAARAGAGLVGVASTEAVKRVLATRLPEATYPLTLPDPDPEPEKSADKLARLLPEQAVLLIGPGLGRAESTDRFLRRLLTHNAFPGRHVTAVIDADALSLLAGWEGWWERIGKDNVLTPHAGEMARLVASDPGLEKVEGEAPWDTARRAAVRWKQIIVLKGPFTTVAISELNGRAWVYPHPNPALATAGTGDVLAGLIAGLASQDLTGFGAAKLGVVVHALAARRIVERRGVATIVAADLPPELPIVLSELARQAPARGR